jgi:hypothetical protein
MMDSDTEDEFIGRALEAINSILLDMFAALANEDRRLRRAQGQAKTKAEGRYKGRPEDTERNGWCALGLYSAPTDCSRATIARSQYLRDWPLECAGPSGEPLVPYREPR